MSVIWDTPADRKAEWRGAGAWLAGDTLVRGRFDAVTGFDAATGERSWEYVPPGRSSVCHSTADTARSVLVLVRDGDGASSPAKDKSCTSVVAIDMQDGHELWQARLSEPDPLRLQDSSVSAGGGVAVLLQQDQLRAVDVRTGKPRWKAALPKGCVPGRTAAAEHQIAAVLACGGEDNPWDKKVAEDAELHTAAFDLATGTPVWGGTPDDDRLDGDSGYRLLVQDGKLTVLTSHRKNPYRVRALDPATGGQREVSDLPDGMDSADRIFTYRDRLIVARYDAYSTGRRPFTAYERR
ncbi:outer membrane protein assembly factor BamB family protein [Streptomyces roseolus]